jgi:hypothetical protein
MPTWTAAGRYMSSAGRLKKLKYAWKELGLETGSLLSPTDQGVRNLSLNHSDVKFVILNTGNWSSISSHSIYMVAHHKRVVCVLRI